MTSRTEVRKNLTALKQEYGGESVFQALVDPDSADAGRLGEDEMMHLQQAVDVLDNEEIARSLTGDEDRAVEIGGGSETASGGSITLVSRARPLTPSANDDLQDYDPMRRVTAGEIEDPPLGVSDGTLVGYKLGERPPQDVIDRYQLDVEEDTLPDNTPPEGPSDQFMENNDMGVEVNGTEIRVPLKVGPWEWSSPSDDPQAGLGQGPTTVARWVRGENPADPDAVVAVRGRGTNYRALHWPTGEQDNRETLFGPVGGVEVLRNVVDELPDLDESAARGVEETPQGTAAMQDAGLSNSGTDAPLTLDVYADRDGSTEFPYSIPNADGNGIPRRVVQEANEAVKSEIGGEEQYTMQRPVGTARFDDSRDPPRFIAFDPADSLPFDLLDDADSGTSMFEVVVGRQGSINVYEVEGVSRLSGLRNDARGIVDDEIGDARQYQRGETVGQVRILDTDDGKMVDRFEPRDDLVSVMDYDTDIDPRSRETRGVTASDISYRFDDDDLDRQAVNTAIEVLRAEFGEPTEFPDGTVVGQIAFEELAPDEYIVAGVNQRLEGEPDDTQDVVETDLGSLEPEQVSSSSSSTTEQETFDPADTDDEPPEFPTEPDEATRRAREQRGQQQRSLGGGQPDVDPEAQRREEERRERRQKRAEQQKAEEQIDLLESAADSDDDQPGLSAFNNTDEDDSGGSGN